MKVRIVPSLPSRDDLAVWLKGDRMRHIIAAAGESRRHFAIAAKARIETAITVVARQLEVVVVITDGNTPGHDDLAVGLERHGVRITCDAADNHSSVAEGRVERAVRVVAHQRMNRAETVVLKIKS